MKKIWFFVAIVSLLLNVFLVYFFMFRGDTVPSEDHRVEILMDEPGRDFALNEMRGFLESVQEIHDGMLGNDYKKISKAASRSGGAATHHAPPGLMASLPMGFKKMGFATHDQFDAIAKMADSNVPVDSLREALNTLMINCVTCHKTYKIGSK